ncbi:uncharacterized protein LOC8076145 [Sorghum bicolor]|jgi:hypothetical protein|uniref:uncharacterized protein LOC8076145 n=1 Tax=Sorghum bicolor TaxID=4558 RepID=UPI000B42552D|nr:uncharacterized protein LOC8076145 [Sorghum bicolor]|eukprot:XP_002437893.2 uncharacterized protein LOC8076145 [Sorghum bicolor]
MDLFPDGGFVRLRNRARDKYVHADEDASGVSLRPLGAVPFRNVVWKVKVWPVEGVNYLLLEGAAYGRHLAAPNEDDHAPSGHRGVRAVQLDFNSLDQKGSFVWLAVRVEAGQNYVRLHNKDQRYLRAQRTVRANGRHRYWNNLVTVDVRNDDETTMMQWRVEAIPSTPELLPLPPPPPPPVSSPSFLLSTPLLLASIP